VNKRRNNQAIRESKKQWLERTSQKINKEIRAEKELIRKHLNQLEERLFKRNYVPFKAVSLLENIKREFGNLETNKTNEETLQELIIDNLKESGGVLLEDELINNLMTKLGISENDLREVLKTLNKKGVIGSMNNVIFIKRPAESDVAKKILHVLKERKKVSFKELINMLEIDKQVLKVVLNDLASLGQLVIDDTGEIAYLVILIK